MILVDTTVVIEYTRGKDLKLQALLLALPVAVCGLTRTEVLQGSRGPADRQKLLTALAAFQFLSIPDTLWDTAGDNLAALRSKGITALAGRRDRHPRHRERHRSMGTRSPLSDHAKGPHAAEAVSGAAVTGQLQVAEGGIARRRR